LSERSFLFLFLGTNTLTVVMLPILILVKFRTWLDAARLLLLLVCHISIAASFIIWNPTISCPGDTPDGRVCRLLNLYIIVASWVPPLLLILYGIGLATYAWRCASNLKQFLPDDPEETRSAQPSLPNDPDSSLTLTRHLSELMSSPPSTGMHDSRREFGRKSQLEKQRIF